jgi:hypothetical protein
LRRIIIIGTALAVLTGASAAFAAGALNSYTAGFTFSPTKAGTPSSPVPVGFAQSFGASSTTTGNRAAPIVDIKTTIYGLTSNAQDFPTCSAAKIESNHLLWNKACPKGSLVASGPVSSVLGPDTNLLGGPGNSNPCHPFLSVYNGGKGLMVYFFSVTPQAPGHVCVGLKTGAAAPYFGRVKQVGKSLVQDVVLPPDVSTMAGGLPAYGSLIAETLQWRKLTTNVHGKTVGFQSSIGCKNGKRPWSVAYTSVNQGVKQAPITVSGSVKCS